MRIGTWPIRLLHRYRSFKCRIGLHRGNVEVYDGIVVFHCTRCEKFVSPRVLPDDWRERYFPES